jgi:hypothetical protein
MRSPAVPYSQQVLKIAALLVAAIKANSIPPKKGRVEKFWEIIQPFLIALIPSLILFWFAYSFQESVKQDLDERRAGIQSIKEVRDLVRELLSDDVNAQNANSASLAIAAFGRYSVLPLISVLEFGGVNAKIAAQRGLVAVGITEPKFTCGALVKVLDNRRRRYSAIMHRQVIKSLADIGCKGPEGAGGEQALERYRKLLDGGKASLANAILDGSNIDSLPNLSSELSDAISRLSANL